MEYCLLFVQLSATSIIFSADRKLQASDTSGGEIKILKNSVVLKVAMGECVVKMAQFFNVIVA